MLLGKCRKICSVDGGKQTQIRKYYLYFLFGIDQVLLFLRVLVLVLSLLLFLHIDFDVKFQINLGFLMVMVISN